MKGNKGISTIITTVLMIVLVLAAVGVVWAVIQNILSEQEKEITSGLSRVVLSIVEDSLEFSSEGVSLVIYRDIGQGDLSKIRIILYNEDGESEYKDVDASGLSELGNGKFVISTSFLKIEKISIAPIIKSSGDDNLQRIVDTYVLSDPLEESLE
ncbi:archaellin/type IV pilin N-terminal domain-containing protein [Nanoarchaeota archaeon]